MACSLFLTFVFLTMRPGGYDILFSSLRQQTEKCFDLVVIDDLVAHRRAEILDAARSAGVVVKALLPAKPKTRGMRFGQYNAINSGLLFSEGQISVILQDNVFLPSDFVSKTLEFFRQHPMAIVSYPEVRYNAGSRLQRSRLTDLSATSVFDPPIESLPREPFFSRVDFNSTMPAQVIEGIGRQEAIPTKWFECAACAFPTKAIKAINGLDETLDVGDDAQEANIRDRLGDMGLTTYALLSTPIALIDHHNFSKDDTWTRFEVNTNIMRWSALRDLMAVGEYPLFAPNRVNMTARSPCHALPSTAEPHIAHPCNGSVVGPGALEIVSSEYSQICCAVGSHTEQCGMGSAIVLVPEGFSSIKCRCQRADGRSSNVATVRVSAAVIEDIESYTLFPLTTLNSSILDVVDKVMSQSFGLKPHVLFVVDHPLSPLALGIPLDIVFNELRRHFHVYLLNVSQPSLVLRSAQIHLVVGVGEPFGPSESSLVEEFYNEESNVPFGFIYLTSSESSDDARTAAFRVVVCDDVTSHPCAGHAMANSAFGFDAIETHVEHSSKVWNQLDVSSSGVLADGKLIPVSANIDFEDLVLKSDAISVHGSGVSPRAIEELHSSGESFRNRERVSVFVGNVVKALWKAL